ncbi:MAG: hypothetical protein Tsb0021_13050 [Chlamydiales bacterium]
MPDYFLDYSWKEGKPVGRNLIGDPTSAPLSFRVITDPYFKRYTIEKYRWGIFETLTYDSFLLDFRHLTPRDQLAWQRKNISHSDNKDLYLIRDMNDRVIIIESFVYEGSYCRKCALTSPHGILIGTQRIYYKDLGDPFNGVILFDSEGQKVMKKGYEVDRQGNFTKLLEENWDFSLESISNSDQ